MLDAALLEAARLCVPYSVAIVDSGGHLLSFSRQDGARIATIELAINKARSARRFEMDTSELSDLAGPSGPLFGVQHSDGGRVVIFGGGMPVRDGAQIIGAVGASSGTIEQDLAVAAKAVAAVIGRPGEPTRDAELP